jgi:hypothetical protein
MFVRLMSWVGTLAVLSLASTSASAHCDTMVLQLVDDKAAEGPGRSSDGDGHGSFSYVSFCVQASSGTIVVADRAKNIRLWPVLAPSGAVSELWSAPTPPQALAPPAHTHRSALPEYSVRPGRQDSAG